MDEAAVALRARGCRGIIPSYAGAARGCPRVRRDVAFILVAVPLLVSLRARGCRPC